MATLILRNGAPPISPLRACWKGRRRERQTLGRRRSIMLPLMRSCAAPPAEQQALTCDYLTVQPKPRAALITICTSATFITPSPLESSIAVANPNASLISACTSATFVPPQ